MPTGDIEFVIRVRNDSQRALQQVNESLNVTGRTARRVSTEIQKAARDTVNLFAGAFGTTLPREIEKSLAKLPAVSRAAGAALGGAMTRTPAVGITDSTGQAQQLQRLQLRPLASQFLRTTGVVGGTLTPSLSPDKLREAGLIFKDAAEPFREGVRHAAKNIFDALVAGGRTGVVNVLKGLALIPLRQIFANLAAILFGGLEKRVPHAKAGTILGDILKGTIFGPKAPEVVNAEKLLANAQTATIVAGTVVMAGAGGPGGVPGSPFIFPAFGQGGFSGQLLTALPALAGLGAGRALGGGKGLVLGSALAGGIFGALKVAGGGLKGALIGAGVAGGAALGLVALLGLLRGRGASPAERDRQIGEILEANRFAFPEALNPSFALGGGGVDYGFGDVPRAVPRITIHVQTMDARSFMDNADRIAGAVRRAMIGGMSPLAMELRGAL